MKWSRRRDVLSRTSPAFLVVAKEDGTTLRVDGPAHDVWSLLSTPVDEADLIEELAQRYGADVSVVGEDVRGLLAHLAKFGCVETTG